MDKLDKGQDWLRLEALESLAAVLTRPRRRTDVRTRQLDGELVVLDRHHELVHQLNRTASYIWERCDGQKTPAEIAGQVCETFEVDEPTALKDVLEIIQRLERLNLLEST